MAEGRARAKAKARTWAAQVDAARRRAGFVWPAAEAFANRLRQQLVNWAAQEVTPGRLVPWVPVAFGLGIALYFTASREPLLWASIAGAIVLIAIAFFARRRPFGWPVAVGVAALAAGFAIANARTAFISHPVLVAPVASVNLSGFVEIREERARSDRIVLRVHAIDPLRRNVAPNRVRLAVRKGTAPEVGTFVSLKARLTPPLEPLRPGGYDFARDMYFQKIGASGYALGAIKIAPAPVPLSWGTRFAAFVDGIRSEIDRRIRATLPGDKGAIASALITGKRDAISDPVNDAMYISSLAHVLSISGYHMAVVAGIVFFFVRASLALAPSLASRRPIKKWAAAGALIAAAFYLVLSGAEVATQRSFIMIAIVLIGVMLDRAALTFRTLTVAALVVLALAPEALVHPSFQMSFAATLALVSAYQHGLPWRADADSSLQARVALWGGREIAGLILASLVAGFATTPYAAFHFHRLAPYGVLANLFAMPVVSAWVMPMGILGMIALPFGLDAPFWSLMGYGLDWMIAVALWVAALPGAVGRMHAFGIGPLLLVTGGILVVCLLRSPLRWSGAVVALLAAIWAWETLRPDVYTGGDGRTVAVRGADGRLSVINKNRDTFAIKEWLAADGDARLPKDASLESAIKCDEAGCVAKLKDGRLVALSSTAEALAEDCRRAAIVVSPRETAVECAAVALDHKVWRQHGAASLRWNGHAFDVVYARPSNIERPWLRAPVPPPADNAAPLRPSARDATPRSDDLEIGD